MLSFVVIIIGSYLLGSIPAGYLAGRIAGIDIRKAGSGNIGATNVTRTLGKAYGFPVFAFDFFKGLAAVRVSMLLVGRTDVTLCEISGIMAAVSAVIGHSFPIWLRFKGGKGVATSAGALFGLMPLALLIGLVIWAVTFRLTRYVSLASLITAISLPAIILVMISLGQAHATAVFYFAIVLAVLVVFRHRSNLSRLIRGTEPRFERK